LARFRFGEFTLSPRRRALLRNGRELRLIPRYFDLLVLLVQRRNEAVHRRDIFDRVWSDVIVSDSALSQAIRTLRRTLGDDSREPLFIRTVARHGYRFVFAHVIEEDDEGPLPAIEWTAPINVDGSRQGDSDPFEPLLQRLTTPASETDLEEEQRDAAERLHVLGIAEALKRLGVRPGHAYARALLRDTRWDVASAGAVPIFRQPGGIQAAVALVRLRLRRAARFAADRGIGGAIGAGVAGAVAGTLGGVLIAAAPGSDAPLALAAVLAVIGACCGTVGGAGVAAGLSIGEAVTRSQRVLGLMTSAAFGGWIIGCAAQWLGQWSLAILVGVHVQVGGCVEGVVLGGAAGLGYALATRRAEGGLAAPRGLERLRVAAIAGGACALGALALASSGRPLIGGTIHAIAQASTGSHAMLTPIARLIGEPDFGPWTRAVIGAGEGGLFGFGLALGLTRRPAARVT
jgi:DNA-binding winged helix-turn-helix (wHTH) protein